MRTKQKYFYLETLFFPGRRFGEVAARAFTGIIASSEFELF
jgi:hypothetical protein